MSGASLTGSVVRAVTVWAQVPRNSRHNGRVPAQQSPTEPPAKPAAQVRAPFGIGTGVVRGLAVVLAVALVAALMLLFVVPGFLVSRSGEDADPAPAGTSVSPVASSPGAAPTGDGNGNGNGDDGDTGDNNGGDSNNGGGSDLTQETVARLDAALLQSSSRSSAAVVVEPTTGEQLYSRETQRTLLPASNQKIFAALSVFHHVDSDQRLATTVVRGQRPDSVVLVAGGDSLLAVGQSQEAEVEGHAGVGTLARETAQELAGSDLPPRLTVEVDTSVFQGPVLNDAWLPGDLGNAEIGPVAPMAFGSHTVPGPDGAPTGSYDSDAATTVGQSFVQALSRELSEQTGRSVDVQLGGSVDTAADPMKSAGEQDGVQEIARVESATITEQTRVMMENSDNRLAETLCRVAAVGAGQPGSVDGARSAMAQALDEALGRDVVAEDGVVLSDCAGVAPTNRTSVQVLADVLVLGARDPDGHYAPLIATLPVAGVSGTLVDRFDDPQEAAGRTAVRAKTGTLRGVTALSGEVTTADGRPLIAVVLLNDTAGAEVSRDGVDTFFAVLAES